MSKLLLVDDDIELTELLSALLKLEGFEVQTANNGLEALQNWMKAMSWFYLM